MQIGDSFTFDHTNAAGAHKRAKAAGIEVLIRQIEKLGGHPAMLRYRVWRIQ